MMTEIGMDYRQLDTPALLIDREKLIENIDRMQRYADAQGMTLRPHTKTHKMPAIALLQREHGCRGIAVAKTGEAEVMAAQGLDDIFIANEIVGEAKLSRVKALAERGIAVSFGIDCPDHVAMAEAVFTEDCKAEVLIEIEVGENRSGVIEESDFITLLGALKRARHVHLAGVFSHEGHTYSASNAAECCSMFAASQKRTLRFAAIARELGFSCDRVSIGSTPSLMQEASVLPGVTELRPGTYALYDASMAHCAGTLDRCAATVLASVISKPTPERVIADVGAKGLTAQRRTVGVTAAEGCGIVRDYDGVNVHAVYDEHAIIYNKAFHDAVSVGDKIEIIPVHICPVCNLYDRTWLVSEGKVVQELPVLCRGKLL